MSNPDTHIKTRDKFDDRVRDLHPSFRYEANKTFYSTMLVGSGTCAAMAMFHATTLIFDPRNSYSLLDVLKDIPFWISIAVCFGFCVISLIKKNSFRADKHVTYAFSRSKTHIIADFMLATAFPSIAVLVYATYNLNLKIIDGRQMTGVAVLYILCIFILAFAWAQISRLASAERRQDRRIQDEQRQQDEQRKREDENQKEAIRQLQESYSSWLTHTQPGRTRQ